MSQPSQPHLSDPRTRYPRPPFDAPEQSLPGSEKRMAPDADHGEDSYQGSGRLQGMVALITGADSGIGRAIALSYAREGADVAFTYLSETEDARKTERLVEEAGSRVLAFKMDQTQSSACDEVITRVVEKFGRLDILVNNAAYQETYESIQEIPDEDIERVFKTNIEAFFYFSRAALKHLPPGGSIINTTSIQAFNPSNELLPYASTKAAIANFTLSLAKEAIKQGVRVNGVAPGPVWTPLIPATMPKEHVKEFGSTSLFERPAQPAELAPVYVFLASNDASYITGEIYGVTGGQKQL